MQCYRRSSTEAAFMFTKLESLFLFDLQGYFARFTSGQWPMGFYGNMNGSTSVHVALDHGFLVRFKTPALH